MAAIVPTFLTAFADADDEITQVVVTVARLREQGLLTEPMLAKLPLMTAQLWLLANYRDTNADGPAWIVTDAVYRFRSVKNAADLVAEVEAIEAPRSFTPTGSLFPNVILVQSRAPRGGTDRGEVAELTVDETDAIARRLQPHLRSA